MQLKHLVITRFSYRGKDTLKHYKTNSRVSEDPLEPERLELRFKLFESICLPSVLAQSDQEFSWLIIIDKDLQPQYKSRLESLLKDREYTYCHTFNPDDELDHLDWLDPYLPDTPDYILTTNLDDDDALPNNFISAAHGHISSAFELGELPPIKILGVNEIIQWDMITSRRAPLGWRSPWHRGQRTASCGFSLLAKYPHFSFCVLGVKHSQAKHYFDFATAPANLHVEHCRTAFIAAGSDNNEQIDKYPASTFFHDLSAETGPVLMSNHTNNVQKWRLYEGKIGKSPVTGPETFPNLTVDLERFETYSRDFRRGFKESFKSAFGSYTYLKEIRRRVGRLMRTKIAR